MTYFDHNASSPMLPEARQAWLEASELYIGNPSSPHRLGSRAEAALNGARQKLAKFLECDPLDIVWTSGATEANNLVLHHIWRAYGRERTAFVSAIEHPSVLEPAKHYFGSSLKLIPVSRNGVVDLDWLADHAKSAQPSVVAVMAANNETGVIQPWLEMIAICREIGVPFFCDATQWFGKLPAKGLGKADFVTGSAHKFGGPRGVGFVKCPTRGPIEPLFRGGPQEESRRAGTENVPAILSMLRALEIREEQMAKEYLSSALKLRNEFENQLLAALPGSEIVGHGTDRLWNTVMALMPDADCQARWVVKLDKLGFAVSTGSACASGKEKPSHVLEAMAYTPGEAGRALRFSSSCETKAADWEALLEALEDVSGSGANRTASSL
jgi:cysteine desulfurase